MKIYFFDPSNYDSDSIRSDMIQSELDVELYFPTSFDALLDKLPEDKPNILFLGHSIILSHGEESILKIRNEHPEICLIVVSNTIESDISYLLDRGVDDYYYSKDKRRYIYIIQDQIKHTKEIEERNTLLNQFKSSLQELKFQKFALDQSAIVLIMDSKSNFTYVNEQFCKITKYNSEEVIGKNFDILNSGFHDQEFWDNFYSTINQGKVWRGEIKNIQKDGSEFWLDLTMVPFLDFTGKPYKFVGIQFDITYRVLAEQQLTHDAFYDPLTGLSNRAMFLARIEENIAMIHQDPSLNLSVILLNLDQFNRINNAYGFEFGDLVIYEFAKILKGIKNPIATTVSRLGGNSFGLLIRSADLNKDVLVGFVSSIRRILDKPLTVKGEEVYINFSAGVTIFGEGCFDGEQLLKNSELAMFTSKKNLKDDLVFFKQEMMEDIHQRMRVQKELKKAVNESSIIPFFQPIVNCKTKKLVGFEALVRWIHPTLGIVTPYYFIKEAEESGIIIKISDIVYSKSIDFYKKLQIEFPKELNVFISLNLSSMQFEYSIVDYFDSLCKKNSISPSVLHLEITESLAMEDTKKTLEILSSLQEKGFSISIDDFGTGYSSLSYLKEFPLSTMKIDKSFIDHIVTDEKSRSLLETILTLSKSLNLDTIAEGVEDKDQVELLKQLDCDSIQGYFYSKPMSESDAIAYTRNYINSNS
jgi:diguanylate cyclase (GGDEF)-like protein/PAS domain S-box-containing protein